MGTPVRKHGPEQNPTLLVLCQLFYPELISTGQTLTELCEQLVEMGADVEVLCGPLTIVDTKTHIPRYMEHRGIRIKRGWGTRLPKLSILGRIINQVSFTLSVLIHLLRDRSRRPILVLTNPPFLAFVCALCRVVRGRPYLFLVFDVYPETAIKLGLLKEGGPVSTVWNLCNRFIFKQASSIVVIGRCMKEVIGRKVGVGEKIRLVHIWSDDNHIRAATGVKNPFIEKWGLEGKFVAGYSGNMGRFHDMETIMEAASILKDRDDIVFLFIGEGHKKAGMKDFAKSRQLRNCQFHSYVERENLGFSLACADVGLVCLSEGHEGLSVPSKAFGMMAAGVPTIAVISLLSEIAHVIIEEECGLVVRPRHPEELAEAILSLYHDREKLEFLGRNARRAIDAKYNLQSAGKFFYDLICDTE